MANQKSAIKRHKQSLKRAARNRSARTRVKNVIKSVRTAVLEKDAEKAAAAFQTATSVLDKSASKGAIHWRNASRKISRLAKAVASIQKD
ncbi:30S ribosomal protein S20 [Desulfovibrio sp. OttesenSCG-928-A18]|nr:30S ribosomal protein S20 [Desulfovibrio sp. OttesenSCG-928-A18]